MPKSTDLDPGADTFLGITEANGFLRSHGFPAPEDGRAGVILPAAQEGVRGIPFVFQEGRPGLMVSTLEKIIVNPPRWILEKANRHLPHTGGCLPVYVASREFGIRSRELIGAIEAGQIPAIDRGEALHPLLRWLPYRGEIIKWMKREIERKLDEQRASRGSARSREGNMSRPLLPPGYISGPTVAAKYNLAEVRFLPDVRSGAIPHFTNFGGAGKGSRRAILEEDAEKLFLSGALDSYKRKRGGHRPLQERPSQDAGLAPSPEKGTEGVQGKPQDPATPPTQNGNRTKALAQLGLAFLITKAAENAITSGEDPTEAILRVINKP